MQAEFSSTKAIRALGLCSGGLDSILSACILRDQGIQVAWITFETPFFSAAKARAAAAATGIPLHVANITEAYLDMLMQPNCGYGKHMNPCLDCHALMFRLAGGSMRREGFDFLFSGEVLGQRPMSQTRPSLRYVEKHSGYDGYILRPLSAQKLAETIPEQRGWVDRSRLGDIAGRSRKPQIAMAQRFGIRDYPAPAGGCLLTDKGYSRRLQDLFDAAGRPAERDLLLLKYGRHFRIDRATKIVAGRTKSENEAIAQLIRVGDRILKTRDWPGPLVLMPGGGSEEKTLLAAAVCAGYSKAPNDSPAAVTVTAGRRRQTVAVLPLGPDAVKQYLV